MTLAQIRDQIFNLLNDTSSSAPKQEDITALIDAVAKRHFSVRELFSLPVSSTREEIKREFHKYIRIAHSDKVSADFDVCKSQCFALITALLNLAWEIASDKFKEDVDGGASAAQAAPSAAAAQSHVNDAALWWETSCFTTVEPYELGTMPALKGLDKDGVLAIQALLVGEMTLTPILSQLLLKIQNAIQQGGGNYARIFFNEQETVALKRFLEKAGRGDLSAKLPSDFGSLDQDKLYQDDIKSFISLLTDWCDTPRDFAQMIHARFRGQFPGPIANISGTSEKPFMDFLAAVAKAGFFSQWKGYYLLVAMRPIIRQIFHYPKTFEHEMLAKTPEMGAPALLFFMKTYKTLFDVEIIKKREDTIDGFLGKFIHDRHALLDLNANFIPLFQLFDSPVAVNTLLKYFGAGSVVLAFYKEFIHANLMQKMKTESDSFFAGDYPRFFEYVRGFTGLDDDTYRLILTELSAFFPVEFRLGGSMAVAAAATTATALTVYVPASGGSLALSTPRAPRTTDFEFFIRQLFVRVDCWGQNFNAKRFLKLFSTVEHNVICLKQMNCVMRDLQTLFHPQQSSVLNRFLLALSRRPAAEHVIITDLIAGLSNLTREFDCENPEKLLELGDILFRIERFLKEKKDKEPQNEKITNLLVLGSVDIFKRLYKLIYELFFARLEKTSSAGPDFEKTYQYSLQRIISLKSETRLHL